jgi:ribonuclease D
LCSRERLENIARSGAKSVEELASVPDLRRWQIEEMGAGFISALS